MSGSPTTTANLLPNLHPGEILHEEFLRPMALSQTQLAGLAVVGIGFRLAMKS